MRVFLLLLGMVGSFGLGAYFWSLFHQYGPKTSQLAYQRNQSERGSMPDLLVRVGDDVITREQLELAMQLHLGLSQDSSDANGELEQVEQAVSLKPLESLNYNEKDLYSLRQRLIGELIERRILWSLVKNDSTFDLNKAERWKGCMKELGHLQETNPSWAEDPDLQVRLKNRLCEQAIIGQYFNEKVNVDNTITEQEIADYYEKYADEFKIPARVVIRQILLSDERMAKKVRHKVKKTNFAQLARLHSIAPEAKDGGKLGPFNTAGLPQVFKVALNLRPGEISDIQKSTYGFHLIMLEASLRARTIPLREARSKIRQILLRVRKEEEYRKWVDFALHTVTVGLPKPL